MSVESIERAPTRRAQSARHVPGEPEFWLFIMGDLTVFGVFFGVWAWGQTHSPQAFEIGRASMIQPIGLGETLALITSSAAVATALNHARAARWMAATRGYLVAIACGGVFVVLKAVEYTAHLSAGQSPAGGGFYMYYFVFTGIHLLHVLVGLLGLSIAARSMRSPKRLGIATLEGIGVYWHMVDVLWVVLFALIYLI